MKRILVAVLLVTTGCITVKVPAPNCVPAVVPDGTSVDTVQHVPRIPGSAYSHRRPWFV